MSTPQSRSLGKGTLHSDPVVNGLPQHLHADSDYESDDGLDATKLRAEGFDAKQLQDAGFSLEGLIAAKFDARHLEDAGLDARQLRDSGFSNNQLVTAGFSAGHLRGAGVPLCQLRTLDSMQSSSKMLALAHANSE